MPRTTFPNSPGHAPHRANTPFARGVWDDIAARSPCAILEVLEERLGVQLTARSRHQAHAGKRIRGQTMTPDPKCTPEVARKVVYEFTMFGFLFEKLKYAASESGTFLPGEIVEVGTAPMSTPEKREVFAQLESYLLHSRTGPTGAPVRTTRRSRRRPSTRPARPANRCGRRGSAAPR